MKITTKNLFIALAFASFASSPALFADEKEVSPEIAVCEGHPVGTVIDEEVEFDAEVIEDETTDTEEPSDEVVEVTDEETIEEGEEPKIVICFEEWFYRPEVEDESGNPEVYYMSTGRPTEENQRGEEVTTASNAPDASDEQSAVTVVEAKSVTTNIQRAVAKPSAVRSKGRVFLR